MKNRLTPLFHLMNLLHERSALAEGKLATARAEPCMIEVDWGR